MEVFDVAKRQHKQDVTKREHTQGEAKRAPKLDPAKREQALRQVRQTAESIYVTISEAAEMTGASESTLRAWLIDGKMRLLQLEALDDLRANRICLWDVTSFKESNPKKVAE
jgi:hypothetical protein